MPNKKAWCDVFEHNYRFGKCHGYYVQICSTCKELAIKGKVGRCLYDEAFKDAPEFTTDVIKEYGGEKYTQIMKENYCSTFGHTIDPRLGAFTCTVCGLESKEIYE